MTREDAVVLLLRLRHEWVPGPVGSRIRGELRGEVSSHWFDCPRCGGKGELGRRVCDRCLGRGCVKGDAYTFGEKSQKAVEYERMSGETETAKMRRARADRELRRLETLALHRQGSLAASEREPWEASKHALYASGSFKELEQALKGLDDLGRHVLETVFGPDSSLRTIGPTLEGHAREIVMALAEVMPDCIEVPAGDGQAATIKARRDREVLRLHLVDGLNMSQIGARLGVDRRTVSRVIGSAGSFVRSEVAA